MLPAAEGRRRSCTHKTQTDKTIWRTKRTSCVYSVPMILRDEIIIFKGGGVVSVSSCLLILNINIKMSFQMRLREYLHCSPQKCNVSERVHNNPQSDVFYTR